MFSEFFNSMVSDHPSRDLARLPEPIRNEVLAAMEATSVYDVR